jgi:hypothetical protein
MYIYRDNDAQHIAMTMFTCIVITMLHDSVITIQIHSYNNIICIVITMSIVVVIAMFEGIVITI